MKTLSILLLLHCVSIVSFAQENKGKIFIETRVKVYGGAEYVSYMGNTGFSVLESKREYDSEFMESDSENNFAYSLAPRIGYFIGNKLSAGVEFQYLNRDWWSSYYHYTGGIFARYSFLLKRLTPFLEVGGGMGKSKETEYSWSSGGGRYQSITRCNLGYFSASTGILYGINDKFSLGLALNYQLTSKKFDDASSYSTSWTKQKITEFAPFLTFSYRFN